MTRGRTWWALLAVGLAIVVTWPPDGDRSLLVKGINWAADPSNSLPFLPPQLDEGQDDDYDAVEAHDAMVRAYFAVEHAGGWTRTRMHLKTATDPFNPATERQLLLAAGLIVAFVAWRRGERGGT